MNSKITSMKSLCHLFERLNILPIMKMKKSIMTLCQYPISLKHVVVSTSMLFHTYMKGKANIKVTKASAMRPIKNVPAAVNVCSMSVSFSSVILAPL